MLKYFLAALFFSTAALAEPPAPQYQIPNTQKAFPCWDADLFLREILVKDGYRNIASKVEEPFVTSIAIDKNGTIITFVVHTVQNKICVTSATDPGMEIDENFSKK